VGRAAEFRLGQGLHRLFGEPQILAAGDFEVDCRALDHPHSVADRLDQAGLVGRAGPARLAVPLKRLLQQLAPEDLWGLGLPESAAVDRLGDAAGLVDPLERGGDGNRQNRRRMLDACREDTVDPGLGKAGAGRVVGKRFP